MHLPLAGTDHRRGIEGRRRPDREHRQVASGRARVLPQQGFDVGTAGPRRKASRPATSRPTVFRRWRTGRRASSSPDRLTDQALKFIEHNKALAVLRLPAASRRPHAAYGQEQRRGEIHRKELDPQKLYATPDAALVESVDDSVVHLAAVGRAQADG